MTRSMAGKVIGHFRTLYNVVAARGHGSLDVDRSQRRPAILGTTQEARDGLGALSIMVVGAGSVGRDIILGCARQGIGSLWIVDRGRLKAESLLTHEISARDIGSTGAGVSR